jgi:hypothetical protein
MSQQTGKTQTIAFPIPTLPHLKTLKSIADYLDITIDNLKENNRVLRKTNPNDDLDVLNNQKPAGYKIIELAFEANIHHCDDTKFDNIEDIVNPTIEADCEHYFRYTQSVSSKNEPICEINNKNVLDSRVNNTIKILNLNATNLCKERVLPYETAQNFVADLTLILESNLDMSNEDIRHLIENTLEDIYAKTEDKLEPFCFVTASVVWNSFL